MIDAKANGRFVASVDLQNINAATKIAAQLFSADGKKLGTPIAGKIAAGRNTASFKAEFASHKNWSAETPDLYKVVFFTDR